MGTFSLASEPLLSVLDLLLVNLGAVGSLICPS